MVLGSKCCDKPAYRLLVKTCSVVPLGITKAVKLVSPLTVMVAAT